MAANGGHAPEKGRPPPRDDDSPLAGHPRYVKLRHLNRCHCNPALRPCCVEACHFVLLPPVRQLPF